MPPTTKPLRSDKPSHHSIVVGFSVEADGDIIVAPRRFRAEKDRNDIITWVIGNKGPGPITVRFTDFKFKINSDAPKGSEPINPFIWLASDTARVEAGAVGFIAARLDPNYELKSQGLIKHDHVSYTIETRSAAKPPLFDGFNHDPDGEIKP